jgi:diguanylate cyclase (GGDEF)-like protein
MQPSLAAQIDGELTKRWHEPRSAALGALYVARQDAAQRQDVRVAAWIAGLLYILFAATDAVLIGDVLRYTATARLAIGLTFIIGMEAQIARAVPLPVIDRQCAAAVVIAYGAWLWLSSYSDHHLSASYYMIFGIIFMMVSNLFFNFGFGLALLTSGVIAVSFHLALLTVFTVSYEYAVAVGTLYVSTFVLTLYVNWKLNRERYRVFLNAVRAELQQAEVVERGAALLRLSTTDALTGLANRRAVDEALRAHWEAWQGRGEGFGVVLIDIDYFKLFNDHYGHQEGDRCLVAVAAALERVAAAGGCAVGRFGGEEFILLARAGSRRQMTRVAEAVRGAIEALDLPHCQRPDRSERITVSVGAAHSADVAGNKVERLVTEADRALYAAKASDRNCVRVFDRDDPDRLGLAESVADLVRTALVQNRVSLVYQPILDARTGAVVAAEALMRLTAPGGAPISPAVFIPVAERTGAIVELGKWAVRTACREALAGAGLARVSVNVSAAQFRVPGFALAVAGILAETGIAAGRLALEVTEGHEIETQAPVMQGLAEMRELGVQLWLDDFGTGFAGLSCLRSLPFDVVKIDRSFLHAAGTRQGLRMLEDIIGLVRNAGPATVIEGIETDAQRALLAARPVDMLQGFRLGRPMPIEALRAFLREREEAPDRSLSA